MNKLFAALMAVITLVGIAIVAMLAPFIPNADGGGWLSRIPVTVYICLIASILICAWDSRPRMSG
ncbi:hypothetical protein BCM02_10582 [Paenibacillus methanolicus]|uniref:Uncharacterized protein n=1 Tax=Paenibacillus methanolicus TaxID=582686 RepID=A0A5S5C7F9_9BACL|nr:hypothetical protein BCM02_10582 [Paenibacillus methanolicus]